MPKYAERTPVTPEETLNEIRQELKRFGAGRFAFSEEELLVEVLFEFKKRRVRFSMPLPAKAQCSLEANGRKRPASEIAPAHERAVRSQYRALLLNIKSKLVAVEQGVETFDQAFMAHLLLPNGATVAEWIEPQLDEQYLAGRMPPLLMSGKE